MAIINVTINVNYKNWCSIDLQVSVYNVHLMAVINALQDLLHTVAATDNKALHFITIHIHNNNKLHVHLCNT